MEQGAGILFVCIDDNTLLLAMRSSQVSEPGTWGTFGGAIEPNEDMANAAIRETKEEAGVLPLNSRLITTLSNGIFKIFISDISLDNKDLWMKKIKLNKEHTKIQWFKLGELPDNLHKSISIIKT